jgi:hypothetical protein
LVLTSYCSICGRTVYLGRGDDDSSCPVCSTPLLPVDGWDRAHFEERIATNEAKARAMNERIDVADTSTGFEGPLQLLCECGDSGCNEMIELTIGEYEVVRGRPTQFAVSAGHEIARVEAVVKRGDGYRVVEKLGRPERIAEEENPRP